MEAAQSPWRRLGALLVGRGLITEQELEEALAEQASTNERLGEILVARRLVSALDLTNVLMDQLGRELTGEDGLSAWGELRQLHPHRGSAAVAERDPARDPTVAEEADPRRRSGRDLPRPSLSLAERAATAFRSSSENSVNSRQSSTRIGWRWRPN